MPNDARAIAPIRGILQIFVHLPRDRAVFFVFVLSAVAVVSLTIQSALALIAHVVSLCSSFLNIDRVPIMDVKE